MSNFYANFFNFPKCHANFKCNIVCSLNTLILLFTSMERFVLKKNIISLKERLQFLNYKFNFTVESFILCFQKIPYLTIYFLDVVVDKNGKGVFYVLNF